MRCLDQKDGHLQSREQLVSIAKDEPDELTEFEGMVDFHCWFDSHVEAERLANSAPRDFAQTRNRRLASVLLRGDLGLGYIEGRPTCAALIGKRRTS